MGLACQLSIQAATVAAGCALYWLYKRLSKPKSVKLTYFDVRATPGEKIRLALALSGTPFEDNRIKFTDWPALKPKTKYGAMPFAEIDGVEYAQSGAILRWAGGLGDGSLYPSGMAERMKVEEMLGVSDDLQRAWTPAFYMSMKPEQFGYTKETAPIQKLREKFMKEEFGKYITFIENELKQTGAFVCGAKPTIADCQLYPQIHYFSRGIADFVSKDSLEPFPLTRAWIARMQALPAVKEFETKAGYNA